jgi:dipeptidase E
MPSWGWPSASVGWNEQEALTGRLLLLSNSTLHGSGYLDHAAEEIRDFLGRGATRVLFVPYAMHDRGSYALQARGRFARMGYLLDSIHDAADPRESMAEAAALFIGGGNTFRLLAALQALDLVASIRRRIGAGAPYIGSSAGSIVACPTLQTTKDMPIVEPRSFEALGLVEFQISPHFLDPDPASTHMGETQEERIVQYLQENDRTVAGLREGAMLRVEENTVLLKGSSGMRVFRRGHEPVETRPVADVGDLLRHPAAGAA